MTALNTFRTRAQAKHPGLTLELSGGTVTLRSVAFLSDAEIRQLKSSQKRLDQLDADDDSDPGDLRAEMVNLLAGISTDKALTARELDNESLAVLGEILEEYGRSENGDATKSSGDSPAAD